MKTRRLSWLLTAAALLAAACSPKVYSSRNSVPADQPDGGTYTERTVPVVYKVIPDNQVTLRFYDDMPNVAYISAADFQSIVLPGSVMTVTHTGPGEYRLTNADAEAAVDVTKDTFLSDGFEAFTNQMGLLQPGMPNVYYDGMPFVRFKSLTMLPESFTTVLDFGAYGIDIRSDGKGAVYFPFATLADMYTDLFYHHAGFNGEKVVANISENEVDLSVIDPDYYKPILASMERPKDMAEFNYKELCFAMDHFYGFPGRVKDEPALKEKGLDKALEEEIEGGREIKKLLLSEKLTEYFVGMMGMTGIYMDGHTGLELTGNSLGENPEEKYPDLVKEFQETSQANQGVIMAMIMRVVPMMAMAQDQQAIKLLRPKAYGEGVTYVKKGDTAVCVFDSFNNRNLEAWNAYYAGTGPMPTVENTEDDDMVIFLDALRKAADDPEVKNFIVDISANGGGSLDVVLAMTSLLMDQSYIVVDNSLTGQRSYIEYEVDRNFNRSFDAADRFVRYDKNFAVLTSGMSFSCGNLFPSILKDNRVPVMGVTSGGGACAIQAMCTADGFCYQISSFRARLNDLAGHNIDPGITPTIPIPVDGKVEVTTADGSTASVKDFTKFFDIDYLRSLLEK